MALPPVSPPAFIALPPGVPPCERAGPGHIDLARISRQDVAVFSAHARRGSYGHLALLMDLALHDQRGLAHGTPAPQSRGVTDAERALFTLYRNAPPAVRDRLAGMLLDLPHLASNNSQDASAGATLWPRAGRLIYIARHAAQERGMRAFPAYIDALIALCHQDSALALAVDDRPDCFWNPQRPIEPHEIERYLCSAAWYGALPCSAPVDLDHPEAALARRLQPARHSYVVPVSSYGNWRLLVVEYDPASRRCSGTLFDSNLCAAPSQGPRPVPRDVRSCFWWIDIDRHVHAHMQQGLPEGSGLIVCHMIEQLTLACNEHAHIASLADALEVIVKRTLLRIGRDPQAFGRDMRLRLDEPLLVCEADQDGQEDAAYTSHDDLPEVATPGVARLRAASQLRAQRLQRENEVLEQQLQERDRQETGQRREQRRLLARAELLGQAAPDFDPWQ